MPLPLSLSSDQRQCSPVPVLVSLVSAVQYLQYLQMSHAEGASPEDETLPVVESGETTTEVVEAEAERVAEPVTTPETETETAEVVAEEAEAEPEDESETEIEEEEAPVPTVPETETVIEAEPDVEPVPPVTEPSEAPLETAEAEEAEVVEPVPTEATPEPETEAEPVVTEPTESTLDTETDADAAESEPETLVETETEAADTEAEREAETGAEAADSEPETLVETAVDIMRRMIPGADNDAETPAEAAEEKPLEPVVQAGREEGMVMEREVEVERDLDVSDDKPLEMDTQTGPALSPEEQELQREAEEDAAREKEEATAREREVEVEREIDTLTSCAPPEEGEPLPPMPGDIERDLVQRREQEESLSLLDASLAMTASPDTSMDTSASRLSEPILEGVDVLTSSILPMEGDGVSTGAVDASMPPPLDTKGAEGERETEEGGALERGDLEREREDMTSSALPPMPAIAPGVTAVCGPAPVASVPSSVLLHSMNRTMGAEEELSKANEKISALLMEAMTLREERRESQNAAAAMRSQLEREMAHRRRETARVKELQVLYIVL
ncbi:hypothetical protein KIPB_007719 [Kipferlia bialata]|uniref:Uncharacterized protein n=1 Tax=Kipferlia bialata TaxID=797122 RepID=A0A9K3D1B8_9EUKA|nr:hypothetical protein KIPB_007719 [Kipferlia bialata]|eukprot:g7719.t1